ncbi:hypothetical protein [Cellulophaga sp. E16_2]|uniref:hypothetical protein n=1 Tax=Cellulophaga sp. E16_2 TaxID=2789297 RepID=UPI001A92C8F0|nr:hypothetical protein [Cellulophaga sp. E16_2]
MDQLAKRITAIPKRNRIDLVGIDTGEFAIKADDIEFIEDRTYKGKVKGYNGQWVWLGFILFYFILFKPYQSWIGFFVFLIFGGIFGFIFIYHYIAPTKHFIANRQTGKLHMPISKKKPQKIVNFNDGDGIIKSYYIDSFYTSLFFQTKMGIGPKAAMGLADWNREDYWNFLVWYMDKNRPLPPGAAFDEYRLQDFERRKAKGFPKPLYPSDIPTPEATPEQQAERRKIGGW